MTRIFSTLAVLDTLGLLAAFSVGWLSYFRGALDPRADDRTYMIHFQLGLYAILINLGVHCLIFIYFLGTGRWVKEVALAYDLPDAPLPRLTRELKRATFPPALFAMLAPIVTAAVGLGRQMHGWPASAHAAFAIASLAINFWAFGVEFRNVRANVQVLDDVEREVDRIRVERGLPSNAEALKREGGT